MFALTALWLLIGYRTSPAGKGRRLWVVVVMLAMFVRFAATWSIIGTQADSTGTDGLLYHKVAIHVMEQLHAGIPVSRVDYAYTWYTLLLGIQYALTGASRHAGSFVNAFHAAWCGQLLFLTGLRLGFSRRKAGIVAAAWLFMPNLVIWTSDTRKESISFLAAMLLWHLALVLLQRRKKTDAKALLLLSVICLLLWVSTLLRIYMFFPLGAGLAVTFLLSWFRTRRRPMLLYLALITASMMLIGVQTVIPGMENHHALAIERTRDGDGDLKTEYQGLIGMLFDQDLPRAVNGFFTEPHPSAIRGISDLQGKKLASCTVQTEMILWYACMLAAILGMMEATLRRNAFLIGMIVFVLLYSGINILIAENISDTYYRYRAFIVAPVLLFCDPVALFRNRAAPAMFLQEAGSSTGGRAVNGKRLLCFGVPLMVFLLLLHPATPVLAEDRFSISEKNIEIVLNPDGSADVSERIVFAMKGSVNNLVMEIDKPEGCDVELQQVVSFGLKGPLICQPLEGIQWDPTVLSGTYSVIHEPDRLKVKVYYSFGRHQSIFVLKYRIGHAARRYPGVGDFSHRPVSAEWPTRVCNIHVRIRLPAETQEGETDSCIRGVSVGKSAFDNKQIIDFNIPDTVPGENLIVRILFPSSQLSATKPELEPTSRDALRQEERLLNREAMELSLRAREKAALDVEKKAHASVIEKRLTHDAAVISVFLSLIGLLSALLLSLRMRSRNPEAPDAQTPELLQVNPWMIRMLLHHGRFDARGLLSALLHACEVGKMHVLHVSDRDGKTILTFAPTEAGTVCGLSVGSNDAQNRKSGGEPGYCTIDVSGQEFDEKLLAFVVCAADTEGYADFGKWSEPLERDEWKSRKVRDAWRALCAAADRIFASCGFSADLHRRMRDRALGAGMLFFGSGLFLGVSIPLPQGYLLLLPGTWLVMYGTMSGGFTGHAIGCRTLLRNARRQMRRRPGQSGRFMEPVRLRKKSCSTFTGGWLANPSLAVMAAMDTVGSRTSVDRVAGNATDLDPSVEGTDLKRTWKILRNVLLRLQDQDDGYGGTHRNCSDGVPSD